MSRNQGEGDRDSDRRYREDTQDFVDTGKVREKAEEARKDVESRPEELEDAENKGKERAKEEDPAVKRDYSRPDSR